MKVKHSNFSEDLLDRLFNQWLIFNERDCPKNIKAFTKRHFIDTCYSQMSFEALCYGYFLGKNGVEI